jgi:hypothetical protein
MTVPLADTFVNRAYSRFDTLFNPQLEFAPADRSASIRILALWQALAERQKASTASESPPGG